MKSNLSKLFLILLLMSCFSCGSYKQVPYYQDLDHNSSQEKIINFSTFRIQPGDLLGIHVSSANADAASVFNSGNGSGTPENNSNTQVYGYRVGVDGKINLPILMSMSVAGLTAEELSLKLTTELTPYFKNPVVSTRILNLKISVMGDVLKPDIYTIQNDHINVNEALTMAGDLNITAKRKNVLLIREQNGVRQYFRIDLTKKETFNQPYYYLQNNDVIYVEPDRTKYSTVDRGYKNTSLILSGFSAIAIVISALLIQQK